MNSRISTRRCSKGKVPCQEIQNIFNVKAFPNSLLIPETIRSCLPSTKKISCEFISRSKQIFPKKSHLEALNQIRTNMKLQFQEIMKLEMQEIQSKNVIEQTEEKALPEIKKEIQEFETPIRKIRKTDDNTRQDLQDEIYKDEQQFEEQKVIDRLEDYLSID